MRCRRSIVLCIAATSKLAAALGRSARCYVVIAVHGRGMPAIYPQDLY